jgi:sulfatase maturation enzyme AslB (radical SAM superfamily)
MENWSGIRALHIVLTAQCNLRCAYCFENNKSSKRMDWSVLQAALDFALRHGDTEIEFIFSGGEPLLEMPLIQRAIAYVERHRTPALNTRYSVLSNGTLLDDAALSFLARHDAEIQISFDGVAEAQDARSPGSFTSLDNCLDRVRASYPVYYRRQLSTASVVTPQSLSNLPRSVGYFLSKEVPKIQLAPDFTVVDGWRPADIDRMDRAFAEVYQLCRRHYDDTGEIPLRMFQTPLAEPPAETRGRSLCGIMRGEKPAVDTNGQVFGCGAVAVSFLELPAEPVSTCFEKIRLGHIEDPELPGRLADYRRITRPVGLFDNKQHNWSSYGRCCDCKHLFDCTVCPVSIGYVRDNEDMNRVPDFVCAYNLVSLNYRERFWTRRVGAGRFRTGGSQRLETKEA